MKTYLECIPCFFKQALEAAKICGAEESVQKKILNDVARALPKFTLNASLPEVGVEKAGFAHCAGEAVADIFKKNFSENFATITAGKECEVKQYGMYSKIK